MAEPAAERPVLLLIGGGGFVWEARSLWSKLPQSTAWAFVIPDDSVTPDWTRAGTVHKLPTFASRSQRGIIRPMLGFVACLWKAWGLLRRVRPRLIICMGSAMAVPVLLPGRLMRTPSVFIESITRTAELSRTGKLVAYLGVADMVLVQWPELADAKRGYRFEGTVL